MRSGERGIIIRFILKLFTKLFEIGVGVIISYKLFTNALIAKIYLCYLIVSPILITILFIFNKLEIVSCLPSPCEFLDMCRSEFAPSAYVVIIAMYNITKVI